MLREIKRALDESVLDYQSTERAQREPVPLSYAACELEGR